MKSNSTFMNSAQRLTVDLKKAGQLSLQKQAAENPALMTISDEDKLSLLAYLQHRLAWGDSARSARVTRYQRIDRAISTWQKLDKDDSRREANEDSTGKQYAIPMNIPMLATHLDDMTSYFAEALAPISNPFATAKGDEELQSLTKRLNKDALARDYYSQLVLASRSLLKYNLGGLHVRWDHGGQQGFTRHGVSDMGNSWLALDMYNTLWDPTVQTPRDVSTMAEWAATVRLTNRLEMMKRAAKGEWVNLDQILASATDVNVSDSPNGNALKLWQNSAKAVPGEQGQDSRTSNGSENNELDWSEFGLGYDPFADQSTDRPYELTTMYCWVIPNQFGLLSADVELALAEKQESKETYIELWKFELIDNRILVSAQPQQDPIAYTIEGMQANIPIYLTFMTQDQLNESQRSMMELMKGFQRFTSSMLQIYTNGLRKNVWGVRGVDPQMFDTSAIKNGEVAAVLTSKQPGRDVRSGMMRLDSDGSGVEGVPVAINNVIGLKDSMFPGQALPSQVAGLDRAVSSQVATVVQGSQRAMRMLLRLLDSSMMLPSRLEAVRNLKRYESDAVPAGVTDEMVAKALGSGIESMEAERITEALWRLLMAVIQNPESQQTFMVSDIMTYLSRVMNLGANLGDFVRPPEPTNQPGNGTNESGNETPPGT